VNRRDFMHSAGAALAGAALLPRVPAPKDYLWRVGLELYSVRNAMKLDPERTLAAVRAIGYDDVELLWSFGNFGRTPQQVRATLKKEGLKAPSGHIAPEALLKDWQKSLDDAKVVGSQYLIVPSLPDETKTSLDEWHRWADRFNAAGDLARRAGIWLAFHNEPEHSKPIKGIVPYDVFIERTDPSRVRLQLDVGNMEVGGGNPMKYLMEHRDRYWSFHIKDVVQDGTHDTELGAGRVNLRALLAAIPDVHKKPCYVEQEGPKDELASMKLDYNYLKKLEF
jgi:sugar phosphate isomerase/epimerase